MLLLLVDNGSVYVKDLTNLLHDNGIPFEMHAPHLIDMESLDRYTGVILSGRVSNSKKINEVNSKIILHCVKNDVKLLGICYGAEIIALTLGGTIRRRSTPVKRLDTVRTIKESPICTGDTLNVFQSHSYEISALPDALLCVGTSQSCKYEIIQHRERTIFGTQFHPEMSQDGHQLITRFTGL